MAEAEVGDEQQGTDNITNHEMTAELLGKEDAVFAIRYTIVSVRFTVGRVTKSSLIRRHIL